MNYLALVLIFFFFLFLTIGFHDVHLPWMRPVLCPVT